MFKATMKDPSLLRDSISIVGELIDEGIFKINKNGISITAADRAMVAVVDLKLPPLIFDNFEVDKEENIGINITNFVNVLKRIKPNDSLTLELKENKLHVIMKNASSRRFIIPLIDISREEIPPIDQLEFKAKIKLKSDVLKSGIEDADIVSDSVVFTSGSDIFNMKADGDISTSELTLQKGDKSLLELNSMSEVKARYPLEYLKKMVKASKLVDDIRIQWSKDYPMKMDFVAPDKLSLSFVLAPRVQED